MTDELDPQLPPRLVRELKDLHDNAHGVEVPATLDASILLRGRATIAANRRRRRLLQWVGAAASVAAAFVVSVKVWQGRHSMQPAAPTASIAIKADLDGNGRVDILDAFYLARRVGKESPQPAWDINGDGKIDQADIDAIAAQAVRVGGKS